MHRFRLRHSVVGVAVAAGALAVFAPRAAASNPASDNKSALSGGITLLRRALHLSTPDDVVSHAISISTREATLELELAGGHTRTLSLRAGRVYIDGEVAGSYTPGGALDRGWRRALADGASLDTRALLATLHGWRAALTGDEATAKTHLDDALKGLEVVAQAPADVRARANAVANAAQASIGVRLGDLAALDTIGHQIEALDDGADIAAAIRNTPVRIGDVAVRAGQRVNGDLVVYKGAADIFGDVSGNVVALFGDVTYHRGSHIGRNAVSIGGTVKDDGGTIDGDIRVIARDDLSHTEAAESAAAPPRAPPGAVDVIFSDVRDVLAVFVAFAMLGFGTVFFGRRYLEVVADTASHSFGRSFVVGLLGQLLVLPTFAMLIVGLVFTVVGILLLPFAAIAFVIAAILAVVGGYLAIAHAVGEMFTRRRMANGAFVRAPNAYGYLFAGLIGLLGLWAAAALTAWMGPIVLVFRIAAVIVTWLAATTGFGAVLLSRAGLRETFAGRHIGEMSDEYLWATPPATPTAASRMKMEQK
jgi:hypothetical protein